jgi:hypothetical protein
VAVCEVLL